jgi:hypothetical protein
MCYSKAFLFICIVGHLSCSVFAQRQVTDSLEQKLREVDGTAKVDVLNRLTYEFITHDNDKVIEYNKQALELSKKINYLNGEAKAYTYAGYLNICRVNLTKDIAISTRDCGWPYGQETDH